MVAVALRRARRHRGRGRGGRLGLLERLGRGRGAATTGCARLAPSAEAPRGCAARRRRRGRARAARRGAAARGSGRRRRQLGRAANARGGAGAAVGGNAARSPCCAPCAPRPAGAAPARRGRVRRRDDRVGIERLLPGPLGRADLLHGRAQLVELLHRVGLPVHRDADLGQRRRALAAAAPVAQVGQRIRAPVHLDAAALAHRARLADALNPVLQLDTGREPPVDVDAQRVQLGRGLAAQRLIRGRAHGIAGLGERGDRRKGDTEREGHGGAAGGQARQHRMIEAAIAR
jgi:hypothetical protein